MSIARRSFSSKMASLSANPAQSQSQSQSPEFRKRCRLLDVARGLADLDSAATSSRRPLPCFPLQAHHVKDHLLNATPHDFHARLCGLIQTAKHRVSLASLYIGPAASAQAATDSSGTPSPKASQESALLQALSNVPTNVDVQIVMDSNRGLRKVPIPTCRTGNNTKTSSAEAVAKAIHSNDQHQLYLCQVLPNPLGLVLPNPLNEVAGVFHIKAYVVDDTLILSGANLSEEYFTDRHDRYFQISQGGNGFVDFYHSLIQVVCRDYSEPYHAPDKKATTATTTPPSRLRRSAQPFVTHLADLYADASPRPAADLLSDPSTVAVCIPTFHHPQEPKLLSSPTQTDTQMPHDVDVTLNLLRHAASKEGGDGKQNHTVTRTSVQVSSAYLNPSKDLMAELQSFDQVELLTAGRMSHGFRPKPKTTGNKGKDWIPTMFDQLQSQALRQLGHARLWHWQRPGWTFHAKGIWITQQQTASTNPAAEDTVSTESSTELVAAVVGSSNFGRRSFERDMESNVVMILPPICSTTAPNPLAVALQDEWATLVSHSQHVKDPDVIDDTSKADSSSVAPPSPSPLPWYIQGLFPYIQSFF